MKVNKAFAGIALALGALSISESARADKPADDFLNPQDPGPRLSLMPLFGPGLRVNYDHRFEVEQEVTELRTQLIGDVVVPFSEVSANVDLRLFLLTFGASVGYHNEWNVIQFEPDYDLDSAGPSLGRDTAGQELLATQDGTVIPPESFSDLHREARRVKAQNADVKEKAWLWYEGRLGFIWPAQNFITVSVAGLRNEDRPDVSYDWANGTVMSGGWHLRWETYFFFRDPSIGFIGPAVKILNMPRHRLTSGLVNPNLPGSGEEQVTVHAKDACQPTPGIPCKEVRETELHYGIIGGIRTNWVTSSDVFLTRIYTTFGLDNDLFGTHLFGLPLSMLFAYQVDIAL